MSSLVSTKPALHKTKVDSLLSPIPYFWVMFMPNNLSQIYATHPPKEQHVFYIAIEYRGHHLKGLAIYNAIVVVWHKKIKFMN